MHQSFGCWWRMDEKVWRRWKSSLHFQGSSVDRLRRWRFAQNQNGLDQVSRLRWCHDLGYRHGRLPQLVRTWTPFHDASHLRKHEGLQCAHAPTYTNNNSKSLVAAFKYNRGHHKNQNYSGSECDLEACGSKTNWLFYENLLAAFWMPKGKLALIFTN